ncbi:MAG: hypothetical protein Q9180_004289 [Flavoplaca navasiana]
MDPPSPQPKTFGPNFGGTQIGQQNVLDGSTDQLQNIKAWFSPISFGQKQRDVYKHEYSSSKGSFFNSEEFTSWKAGAVQNLWCYGTGTIFKDSLSNNIMLTSMIYEHLRSIQAPSARVGIACIYCDNQQAHMQTPSNLLASLWPQLCSTDDDRPPLYMENLYQSHLLTRTRPDLEQIRSVIQKTIDKLEKAYVLVDGLDEITDVDRQEDFMESMKALAVRSNSEGAKLHVLMTSRHQSNILSGVSIEVQPTMEEIKSMVELRVNTPRSFRQSIRTKVKDSPDIQRMIIDKVVSKADGVFLIADLHLRSLSSITNITDLREALDKLPGKLNEYYEIAWARISNQEEHIKKIAYNTFAWLCSAKRQLKVTELCHALAVRKGDQSLSSDSMIEVPDILEICHGLVLIETHGNNVRLMHSTVRDFFESQHEELFKDTSIYLTSTCLTYLLFKTFEEDRCDFNSEEDVDWLAKPGDSIASRKIMTNVLRQYPFLDYAAEHWGHHARGDAEEELFMEIVKFIGSHRPLENAHMLHAQVFHASQRRHVDSSFGHLDPLRVAISYRLEFTAVMFMSQISLFPEEFQLMQGGDQLLIALLEALESGQLGIANALLDAGVDLTPRDKLPLTILDRTFIYPDERPKTALDKSVFYGHGEAAALLLKRKIGGHTTARTMKFAVTVGNQDILSHYLSTAKSRAKRVRRASEILHFASQQGNLDIAKFSLEQGALIESEDSERGLTALALAVFFGQCNVVGLLLDAGSETAVGIPDLTGESENVQSLLQAAVTSQQVFKTRLELVNEFALSHSSADLHAGSVAQLKKRLTGWLTMDPRPLELLDNPDFMTAMREDSGHEKIISMLLDHGADHTIRGDMGETLLHLAVFSEPRVNALLQYARSHPDLGMDVDARDQHGRTPLHYAAAVCNSTVMEHLIGHGADVAATDDFAVTTLHYAVFSHKCIQVAQKYGCRVEKTHAVLGNPLQFARSLNNPNVHAVEVLEASVKVLVRQGSLQGQAMHGYQQVPDPGSEVYQKIKSWMVSNLNEAEVLSRRYIKMNLRDSQQQGYLDMLAAQTTQAKGKKREWHLIPEA